MLGHSKKWPWKKKLFYSFYALFLILIPWNSRWIFFDPQFDGIAWEYGRLSIYLNMLLLIALMILYLLNYGIKPLLSKDGFFYWSLIYFIIISTFSAVPQISYFYLIIILLALLFYRIFQKVPKDLSLKIFFGSGLLQSFIALFQFSSQKVISNKWLGMAEHIPSKLGDSVIEFSDFRVLRAYGTLTHPNVLGGVLFVTILIGLYLWFSFYREREEEEWKKELSLKQLLYFLFILSTLTLASFALLASFSRAAILALSISLFCLLIVNISKYNWLAVNVIGKFTIFFVLIGIVFNMWVPGAWLGRLSNSNRLEMKSNQERIESLGQVYWKDTGDLLFGQGLGMNTLVTHRQEPSQPIYYAQPIHNYFVLALAEIGIVGFLVLLGIIFKVWQNFKKAEYTFKILVIGLVVLSLFDHYLWTSWTGWLLVSFAIASLKRE